MERVSLGIDTSCYSTSCAAMEGKVILKDERKLLAVKNGERGLRQSDALFMHIKNLPQLLEATFAEISSRKVDVVCASEFPRRTEDSYMPVFSASKSFGHVLASALGSEYQAVSHQEVHIAAGILSSNCEALLEDDFLALHLSGGTTELLQVRPKIDKDCIFETKIIGGTEDLNAGQFVDRVGVALGFTFPAGKELDKCSREKSDHRDDLKFKVHAEGTYLSFSGPESQARRVISEGKYTAPKIARATFEAIASSVTKICLNGLSQTGLKNILIVGGVAANTHLRSYMTECINSSGNNLVFADAELSGDNAVGAAYIGQLISN